MSSPQEVSVIIEYCRVCDYKHHCQELKEFLRKTVPNAKVKCSIGRRGSFEVKINETLVHSKLKTFAFPVYEDVAENVKSCMSGKEMKTVRQQMLVDIEELLACLD